MDATDQLNGELHEFADGEMRRHREMLDNIIQTVKVEIKKFEDIVGERQTLLSETSETESPNTDEHFYCENVRGLLYSYKELLEEAKEINERLKACLSMDSAELRTLKTSPHKIEEHKVLISSACEDIVMNFEAICKDIIRYFNVLLAIAQTSLKLFRESKTDDEAHILIHFYTKIIIPIERKISILQRAIDEKRKHEEGNIDPNNAIVVGNENKELCVLAKNLIELDCKIRVDQLQLIIIAENSYNLGSTFKNDVDKLMEEYIVISSNCNTPMMHYQLSENHPETTCEKLANYQRSLSELDRKLKDYFASSIETIKKNLEMTIN